MPESTLDHTTIPKTLRILLLSLFEHSGLKSWNIYQNKISDTCITIRFFNDSMSIHTGDIPAQYRRVSPKQATRNKHRADTFRQSKQMSSCHTQTNTPGSEDNIMDNNCMPVIKKRKLTVSSPEIHRDSDTIKEEYLIQSPESVESIPSSYTHPVSPDSQDGTDHFEDSLDRVSWSNEEYQSSRLACSSPSTHQAPHEPIPESTINIDNEHTEVILPPVTFEANMSITPTNYSNVAKTTASVAHDKCTSVVLSQLELDTHAKNPSFTNSILCPCCNTVMTPTHVCENTHELEPEPPDSDNIPPAVPCPPMPPELINPPNTDEGWKHLLNDPDFNERMNAYSKSDACVVQ